MLRLLLAAWFACAGAASPTPVPEPAAEGPRPPTTAESPASIAEVPASSPDVPPAVPEVAAPIPEVAPREPRRAPPGEPIPGVQRPLPEKLTSLPPLPGPDPRVCTTNADCVLSCTPMDTCCGATCGCRSAYNAEGAARVQAHHDALCPRVQEACPAMACAREDARSAACVAGRCRATDDLPGL